MSLIEQAIELPELPREATRFEYLGTRGNQVVYALRIRRWHPAYIRFAFAVAHTAAKAVGVSPLSLAYWRTVPSCVFEMLFGRDDDDDDPPTAAACVTPACELN